MARIKPLVFALCLVPLALLVWDAFSDRLGANPIDYIQDYTGRWALRFLAITLAVTPLRRLTGWNAIIRVRRMLGLFAFFYATLHFVNYVVIDQFFAFGEILKDIAKRPYITVGFTGYVLLIPLAATSTAGMIRRLGGRRWQRLHRLIYVAAVAGVLHYWWLVKADIQRPLMYGLVIGSLLAFRVVLALKRLKPAAWRLQPHG